MDDVLPAQTFEKDLVSIITPVYNKKRFLQQTIESVIGQTYTYWELILVDDASSDGSLELMREYEKMDARIRVLSLEKNMGAAVVRNRVLEAARGQYAAFLDADDLWKKEKLERQLSLMKERSLPFTYTAIDMIGEDGVQIRGKRKVRDVVTYRYLLSNTIIACSSVVIDRERAGDFRMPEIRKGQDFATWLSILRTGLKAYGLDEVLTDYRIVKNSISSNKLEALRRTWRIYRRQERLNLAASLYYFTMYCLHALKKYFL